MSAGPSAAKSSDGWPTDAERENLLTAEQLAARDGIMSSESEMSSLAASETAAEAAGLPQSQRLPPPDKNSEEDEEEATDPVELVMSLLRPVIATMVLVVFLAHEMSKASMELEGGFSEMMVYQEDASDSAGTILGGVLLNSASVVGMLAVVTTILYLLYKFRCYIIIYAWLFLSVASYARASAVPCRNPASG